MNDKKLRIAFIGTLVGAFVLTVAMVLVWKFRFYDPVVSELGTTEDNYTTPKARRISWTNRSKARCWRSNV